MQKRFIPALAALLALVLLCGCGGRGASAVSSQPPVPQSSAVSGDAGAPQPEKETEEEPMPQAAIYYPLPQEVADRITGVSWNTGAPVGLEELAYLAIPYLDFEGEAHLGEMIVHHTLAAEVQEIFAELYVAAFPIAGMVLIDDFGADDLQSMAANNSSAFCSRLILGTDRYSVHSYGSAIDINPVQNPYVTGGEVYPPAAEEYMDRAGQPGVIMEGDVCYNAFTSRGWSWGGHWQNPDYQHFEKDVTG